MVRDDVQIDLHAARVGGFDQGLHGLGLAEMRIGPGEVGDPVAMRPGHQSAGGRLDGLVLEDRGQPHGRRPQSLNVVQLLDHAGQVTAVIEFGVGGVESTHLRVGAIAGVAVGEAVGQQEVDDLILRRSLAKRLVRGLR